jgi:putative NADH-flavin reductase
MAKIILFGARGKLGHFLIPEALDRGHEVTAVTRDGSGIEPADRLSVVAGEIIDPGGVAALAAGHDVAISSIGQRPGDPHEKLSDDYQTLLAGLAEAGVPRVVIVGGAGSSEVAPGQRLIDQPDFPEVAKPIASAAVTALDRLRTTETPVDWAFMSPAAFFDADGPRTGTYRTGTDNLISDANGSYLSYADGAIVVLDEVEQANHHFTRFTVGR